MTIILWNCNIFKTHDNIYDLVFVMAPIGIYSVLCGLGTLSSIRDQCCKKTPTLSERIQIFLKLFLTKKSIVFPFLFFLSPVLWFVVVFRGIFRHNCTFFKALVEFKFIKSFTETSPQLCLQFFIILTEFGVPPSTSQIQSVVLGILTVAFPVMQKFLICNKDYKFVNYFKYYPVFFLNVVFRICTWSTIFMFFYFFYGVLILILIHSLIAIVNYLVLKSYFPELKKEEDYKIQVGQMAVQGFLTIPNLEKTKGRAN